MKVTDVVEIGAVEPWGYSARVDFTVVRGAVPGRDAGGRLAVGRFLAGVVDAIGMDAYGDPLLHWFGEPGTDKEGWSALQFITTSSITLHFPALPRRCFLDVFSCRDFDPAAVLATARTHFGQPESYEIAKHARF